MRPIRIILPVLDTGTGSVFQTQTTPGAQDLVLNGSLVINGIATFPAAQKLHIGSSGDISGVTFTILGTDERNINIIDTITGINANILPSLKYFKTITRISGNAAVTTGTSSGGGGTGTVAEAITALVPFNVKEANFLVGIGVIVTGTINYTVQHSFDDPQDLSVEMVWYANVGMANKSSNTDGNLAAGVNTGRVRINSYDSAAPLRTVFIQGADS